jgi:hypothetical protein
VRPARNAVSALAIALLLALVTPLWSGCGGGNATSETTGSEADAPEDDADDATSGVGGSSRSSDKEWRGWRWKGKRSACFFRHRNSCYDKLATACRAAGCEESACQHGEGVPAVVSCRK